MCNSCLRYGHIMTTLHKLRRDSWQWRLQEWNEVCWLQAQAYGIWQQMPRTKQTELAISKIRASRNLTYQEARDELRITTRNGYSILEHADEFPSVYESSVSRREAKWKNVQNPKSDRKHTTADKVMRMDLRKLHLRRKERFNWMTIRISEKKKRWQLLNKRKLCRRRNCHMRSLLKISMDIISHWKFWKN